MRTETFEHEGAKITVRNRYGEDTVESMYLANMIAEHVAPNTPLEKLPGRTYIRCELSAAIIRQTVKVEGDLGFPMPGPFAPADAVFAFDDALFKDDRHMSLLEKWIAALNRVNRAPSQELHENVQSPLSGRQGRKRSKKSAPPSTLPAPENHDTAASDSE